MLRSLFQRREACEAGEAAELSTTSGASGNPLLTFASNATNDVFRTRELVGAYGTGVDGGLMGEGSLLSDGLKEDELHLREADLGASVPQRTAVPLSLESAVAEVEAERHALFAAAAPQNDFSLSDLRVSESVPRNLSSSSPSPPGVSASANWLHGQTSHSADVPFLWAEEFAQSASGVEDWTSEFTRILQFPEDSPQQRFLSPNKETSDPPVSLSGAHAVDSISSGKDFNWTSQKTVPWLMAPHPSAVSRIPLRGGLENDAWIKGAFEESRRLTSQSVLRNDEESAIPSEAAVSKAAATDLLKGLKAYGDARVLGSEFALLVEKLSSGEMELRDGKLVSADGSPVSWDSVVCSFREAASVKATLKEEEGRLEEETTEAEAAATASSPASAFRSSMRELEAAWRNAFKNGEIDAEELSVFESIFKSEEMEKILEEPRLEERVADIEEEAADLPSDAESADIPSVAFAASNPYLHFDGAVLEEAKRLLRAGRVREAVLCLEAEVQRNPHSSEGWRLLGQTHAENEQDVEAIQCLLKGHSEDPYNLDCLLALGVSLTNELDSMKAVEFLRLWLKHHDDFQFLPDLQERPPDTLPRLKSFVSRLFEAAVQTEAPSKVRRDLNVALGVLYNIDGRFAEAVKVFGRALLLRDERRVESSLNSEDGLEAASLWNKIGATLANWGRSHLALKAYDQALRLRPNYARVWTNRGVAEANMDRPKEALGFYLVALSLNPQASHLWYYVRAALMKMGQFELVELADKRDVAGMKTALSISSELWCEMQITEVPSTETLQRPGEEAALERNEEILRDIFAELGKEGLGTSA